MRQDLTVADDPSVAMRQASASESIYKKQKKSPSSSYAQRRSALNSKLASSPTRPAAPEGVKYTAPHNRRWLPADEKQKTKDSRVVQITAPVPPPSYQQLIKTVTNMSKRLEARLKSWPTGDLRLRVNDLEMPERLVSVQDALLAKDEFLTRRNIISKS